jgi:uncharacterized membrane protein
MDSWIAQTTSLPNLHAALVHFPLALLPLAVGFDLACLLRRRAWLDRAATLLWTLGALVAWATLAAGKRAADGFSDVPPRVQPAIGEHSDWAHWTLYLFAAVAAVRLVLWWRDRSGERPSALPVRGLAAVAALAGLWLLFETAEHGGALVYEHGLGVRADARPTPPKSDAEATAGEAEARGDTGAAALERHPDGTLVWRPGAGDAGAVGTLLTAAAGHSTDAVHAEGGADGLVLHVSGSTLLVLAETLGDVQVDAELALEGFDGTVGVAHHVAGDAGGLFTLGADGAATLLDRRAGEDEVLGRGEVAVPEGIMTLAVSAAGSHLKGLVDGQTVAHGHVAADPPGACGLWLDGEGTVRLVSLTVTPLEDV